MAVPKRKTTPSKRNMRRSHDSITSINIIEDKDSGEPRLSHRIDLSTGMYKGRQVLKQKTVKQKKTILRKRRSLIIRLKL